MTETVIISLLIARLKGYKWPEISKLFRHWSIYPMLLTCLIHIYFIVLMINGEYWFVEYSNYVKTASILFYLILIFKYQLYDISIFSKIKPDTRPLLTIITSPVVIGVLCIVIGTALNIIAVKENGGYMPVFPSVSYEIGYSKIDMFQKMLQYGDYHVFGDHTSKLIFLTDIHDWYVCIMSLGDMITRIFVVMVIYHSIKQCNKIEINIDKT